MINKNKYDVVISGYGPLGQICALMLSHLKISTAVIEKNKQINPKPRASSIDSESLRFLYSLGIFKELNEIFNIPEFLDFILPDGKIVQRSIVRDTADNYPNIVTFYQPDLEKKLREKLQNSDFIDFYLEHEFISNKENNKIVNIKCKNLNTSKLVEIECQFLMACDGINSSIRKKLKIQNEDLRYNKEWLIIDVDNKEESKDIIVKQICDPIRPTSSSNLSKIKSRWEFQLLPGENKEEMLLDENISKLMDKYVDSASYKILRKDVYNFRAEFANSWYKEKTILIGGSAYQFPPFGYQSLNAEIKDINNICWKIHLVLLNISKNEILNTYQSERSMIVKDTISSSIAMGQLIDSIAISMKNNTPLEESIPPEARTQAYGKLSKKSIKETELEIFSTSELTSSLPKRLASSYIQYDNNRILLDELINFKFALFIHGDLESLVSSEIVNFYNFIDAVALDVKKIKFENNEINDLIKFGNFIVRPDKEIFGITDKYKSFQELSETLEKKLLLN